MMSNDLFKNLFIFEMANNHQGSVSHGKKIIDSMKSIVDKYGIKGAVKLQYRNLETFIHKDYVNSKDNKHIPRFLSTKMDYDQFKELIDYIELSGMKKIVTPFDEISVDKCIEHNVDFIKIASSSADDWPLLEKVVTANKPVIVSTGGLNIQSIDNVVSFFKHRNVELALMHCIALYPAKNKDLNLSFISKLKRRYRDVTIGYSGHEEPNNIEVGQVAIAKGAEFLERHVGVPTEDIVLNSYSMNPDETDVWVESVLRAKEMLGSENDKDISIEEIKSLQSLKRGVYIKNSLKKGDTIGIQDVYFAMPCQEGQITSSEFGQVRTKVISSKDYNIDEPVMDKVMDIDNVKAIRRIVHDTIGFLNENNVIVNDDIEIEISHHYGVENFYKDGAVIINLINREYTNKLLIMFPGQNHPAHLHKIKEETFKVIHGDLTVSMDGKLIKLSAGDRVLIPVNTYHSFSTEKGVIFEEVSSKHIRSDSYYKDNVIQEKEFLERKTIIRSFE